MFQDIGVSKDLNEQFKKHLSNSEPLDCTYPLQMFASARFKAFTAFNTSETVSVDFSIQVLSSGSWPFQQSCTFALPSEVRPFHTDAHLSLRRTLNPACFSFERAKGMLVFLCPQLERSYQRFTAFYASRHSGRKLTWLYHLSKGELVTNCFKNR